MRKPWNMEAKNEVMVLLLALETSWINPLVTCFSPFWVSSFTHSSYHYMAYYWYDYLTAAWLCLHLHSGSACETEPSLMMRLKELSTINWIGKCIVVLLCCPSSIGFLGVHLLLIIGIQFLLMSLSLFLLFQVWAIYLSLLVWID